MVMRVLRVLLVALIGLVPILGSTTAVAQTVDDSQSSVEARVALWEDDSDWIVLPCWESVRDTAGGTLYRLYRAAFDREPDAFGFKYWMIVHLVGERLVFDGFEGIPRVPVVAIADHFVRSGEFRNRYGDLGDGAFLDRLYANVMDRTADAGGRAYWLVQMVAGMTRAQVLLHFAESAEFRAMTAGGVPPGYPLNQGVAECAVGWGV
jgi:hypothetical protein